MEERSVFEKFTGMNVETVMINSYVSKTLIGLLQMNVTTCVCIFVTTMKLPAVVYFVLLLASLALRGHTIQIRMDLSKVVR